MPAAKGLALARRFERVIRYVLVGGGVTLVYSALALGLHEGRVIADATLASATAFLVTQPVAFLAHRSLTFPDAAHRRSQWLRFCVMAVSGFVITVGSMKLVDSIGWPFWSGLLVGWIIIPVVNFIISALWVFQTRKLLMVDSKATSPILSQND